MEVTAPLHMKSVLTAAIAKHLQRTRRHVLATRERHHIAEEAAEVALATLIEWSGGPDHIVHVEDGEFTVQHPITERFAGELFGCEVHGLVAARPTLARGTFRAVVTYHDASTYSQPDAIERTVELVPIEEKTDDVDAA